MSRKYSTPFRRGWRPCISLKPGLKDSHNRHGCSRAGAPRRRGRVGWKGMRLLPPTPLAASPARSRDALNVIDLRALLVNSACPVSPSWSSVSSSTETPICTSGFPLIDWAPSSANQLNRGFPTSTAYDLKSSVWYPSFSTFFVRRFNLLTSIFMGVRCTLKTTIRNSPDIMFPSIAYSYLWSLSCFPDNRKAISVSNSGSSTKGTGRELSSCPSKRTSMRRDSDGRCGNLRPE